MTGGKVGAVAGELSSRLAHPAWPTGGAAVLALIAAVGILVLAPAADAQSPCMPWEIYRPSLRMCEAMTDISGHRIPTAAIRARTAAPPVGHAGCANLLLSSPATAPNLTDCHLGTLVPVVTNRDPRVGSGVRSSISRVRVRSNDRRPVGRSSLREVQRATRMYAPATEVSARAP